MIYFIGVKKQEPWGPNLIFVCLTALLAGYNDWRILVAGEICRYMHCYFLFPPMKINALLFSFLLPRFMPLFSLQIIFTKNRCTHGA